VELGEQEGAGEGGVRIQGDVQVGQGVQAPLVGRLEVGLSLVGLV
jgi:hypothetical protein